MIIKGTSRAVPGRLAAHLTNPDTNERVEILQLQSPLADLKETFRDWQFLAAATQGKLGLYHANIDPAEQYAMTADQWQRAVDVLEEELGFQGQPRAIVLHEKSGRQHIHAVWQRTDIDTMTLKDDGWNYLAHERASQRLETEFGHDHVPGKHAKRDREQQPEPPKAAVSHAEWQQAERSGINALDRKAQVTALRANCDNAHAFKNALETDAYILAEGDKRALVIVDPTGKVFSLSRHVTDLKGKAFKEFMAPIDPASLPSVEEARELQRNRAPERQEDATEGKTKGEAATHAKAPPPPVEPPEDLSQKQIRALRKALAERQSAALATVEDQNKQDLARTTQILDNDLRKKLHDREALRKAERARWRREHPKRKGFIEGVQRRLSPRSAAAKDAAEKKEWKDLLARHQKERADQAAQLRADRDRDIEDLKQRHDQRIREQQHKNQAETERYLREHDAARRLLEQVQERRRQQEEQRSRDGPEPPTRAR